MASFLDNPNTLGSFTPYRPEEPVDALTYVGGQKQEQFNQGLNKVQGQIDYEMSLPLVKQEHIDYRNKLMSDVEGKVSHSIASDFSDLRLQNQLGGMIKTVGNDQVIQRGVASTMHMQAEDERMAKDKADGKYNPANEGVYNMGKSAWLNDHDVNSSFGAQYFTPVDYNKKALEVLKIVAQNPNLREADIPFQRGADGSYKKDKNGNPVLDEVMVREKYSGVDPERIQQAIMATFDESDINQLNIEGQWHYRGYSPQDLYQAYSQEGQSRIGVYNASIAALKAKKLEKGADQDGIQKSIETYQDMARQEQNVIGQITPADIAANPESFKSRLFTNNYLSTFSKAFSFENKTSQVMENPYQSYRLNVDRSNREWAQLKESRRHNVAEEGLTGAGLGLRQQELGLKQQEIDISKARLAFDMSKPGKGTNWGQGVVFNSTTPVNDDNSFKALNDDIGTTEQALKGIKTNILTQSADVSGTNPKEREKNLEAIYDNFNKTGALPQSPDLINYVKQRKTMERDLAAMQKLGTDASNYATGLSSNTVLGKQLDTAISKAGYDVKSYAGNFHYSPAEVKDIIGKIATIQRQNLGSHSEFSSEPLKTYNFTPKERVFYERMNEKVGLNPFKQTLKDKVLQPLSDFLNKNYTNIGASIDQSSTDVNSYINQHTNQYLKKSGGIPLEGEEVRQTFAADLNAMITGSGRKDSDAQTISEWTTDKNTTFSIQSQGANNIVLTATHKGDTKQIKMSADEAKSFFGTDFSNPYDNIDQTIKRFGSTNMAGIYANAENAYFQTFDMDSKILSDKYAGKVKADIIPIPNTGSYKIKLWYYDANAKAADKWQPKDIFQKDGTGYNLQSAYNYITQGIGDNTIESIFAK